ncbi:MAG: COX15/CtaA family protein [Bacteroidota bacterium]|nr:COX15/CtaA family protein [Bacteroidota bacterium]
MSNSNLFHKWSIATIICIYMVIIAGGVVRCTGSGMGCPDWPKCFGSWVPPTDISQLPLNYVEKYSKGGTLDVSFNVYKTWTEYINRLIGAISGLSIIVMVILAIWNYGFKSKVFLFSIISLVFIIIQGWLGAKVVATNLSPYMITIHMFLALVIVSTLISAYVIAANENVGIDKQRLFGLKWMFLIVGVVCLIQILFGTQVRQQVDVLVKNGELRNVIVEKLDYIFMSHRIIAWIVVLFIGIICYRLIQYDFKFWSIVLGLIVLIEFVSGVLLTYLGLPYLVQPIHLVLAALIYGIVFYLGFLFWIKQIFVNRDGVI